MQLDEGLDSGPILLQIPHRIDPDQTGGELSAHLAEVGAQALVEALALWERDALRPVPQDHARATYAPKLTRDTARIRWDDPAERVARLIRGLDPKPGAWTELAGRELKLFDVQVSDRRGPPGEGPAAGGRLLVPTGGGAGGGAGGPPAGKAPMPPAGWGPGRGVTAAPR